MRASEKAVCCRVWAIAILVVLFSGYAKAQAPVYHPGDVIRISVTFDGPDAGHITAAMINLGTPKAPSNQSGFSTEIFPGVSKQTGPNTFEVSYTIPETQASGEYPLSQIRALFGPSGAQITLFYNSPTDFPSKTFKIDNPKSIVKPTIKSVIVP
jgi:hypothetical protein